MLKSVEENIAKQLSEELTTKVSEHFTLTCKTKQLQLLTLHMEGQLTFQILFHFQT